MIDLDTLIKKGTDEHVVFQMRSHWIIFLGELLMLVVLGVLPIGLYVMLGSVWPTMLTGTVMRPVLVLLVSAFYLMLWLFFITKFIDYYLDVYLVTSERVLDVSQEGMFSRTVSELDLARVQDVTSEIKGILHSLLDYGNVYIQTAGEHERFEFTDVPHPDKIRKQLLELVENDRRHQAQEVMGLSH